VFAVNLDEDAGKDVGGVALDAFCVVIGADVALPNENFASWPGGYPAKGEAGGDARLGAAENFVLPPSLKGDATLSGALCAVVLEVLALLI